MPYSLPLSSNPEYTPLPPASVPLTAEQDAALFSGDVVGVARRIYQALTTDIKQDNGYSTALGESAVKSA